jgi:hypothetical protein
MSRKEEFKNIAKPVLVNDSRFGLRKIYLSNSGKAKKGVYQNPGRGANGEHNG